MYPKGEYNYENSQTSFFIGLFLSSILLQAAPIIEAVDAPHQFINMGDHSIAIDSSDKVHISYYNCTKGDLKYAQIQSSNGFLPAVIMYLLN